MTSGGRGLPLRLFRHSPPALRAPSVRTVRDQAPLVDRLPDAAVVVFDTQLQVLALAGAGLPDVVDDTRDWLGSPASALLGEGGDDLDELRRAASGLPACMQLPAHAPGGSEQEREPAQVTLDLALLRGRHPALLLAVTRPPSSYLEDRDAADQDQDRDAAVDDATRVGGAGAQGILALLCDAQGQVSLAGGAGPGVGGFDPDAAIGRPVAPTAAAAGLDKAAAAALGRALGGNRHHSFESSDGPGSAGLLVDVIPLVLPDRAQQVLVVLRELGVPPARGWALGSTDVRWRATFDDAPVGMAEVSGEGVVVRANDALAEIRGYPVASLEGTAFRRGLHRDDRGAIADFVRQASGGAAVATDAVRMLHRDGTTRWVVIRGRELTRTTGELRPHLLLHVMDVTDEHVSTQRLALATARLDALVAHGSDVILVLDDAGCVRYASPAAGVTFAIELSSLLHTPVDWWLVAADRPRAQAAFIGLLQTPGGVTAFEVTALHPGGRQISLEVTLSNRRDDPAVRGIICNCRDVTDRVEAAAQLVHQASHDSLTGLPNRILLLDRLESAMVRGRSAGRRCALLLLDLDQFKRVNDSMGHVAGDRVLVVTGRRLSEAVRPGDTVARLGGDEFVVLAEEIDDERAVLMLADRLRAVIGAPIELPDRTVTIGASVGVAISGAGGLDGGDPGGPHALLGEADTALYQAKARGRDRSAVYNQAMRSVASRRLDVEDLVRARLRDGGIGVAYQPIIDLRSGLVVGTEALCRLRDGEGAEVAPAEFISVAEDSGLVVPLGLEVLDLALTRQAAVDAAGRDARMSVNLSARQLAHPGIVGTVSRALGERGVAPDRLVLELTESVLIDGGAQTRRSIEELDDMGVRLALDDFGTGWSSLSYLGRFPIHSLKIDRSFVSALGRPGEQQAITEAIIGLARALRMVTVAEGVETEAQASHLRELGCDCAQGYLYSRPVTAEALEAADLRWRSC